MPVNIPNASVDATKPLQPQAGEVQAPKEAVKAPKGTSVDKREELVNIAKANLTAEEIAQFGAKSSTISFVRALAFSSIKSTYADREKRSIECPEVVGAVFISTEPVKVPRLPLTVTTKTGIKAEDITWEDVPANTEFEVTMMESAVLLTQPQYSGRFMFNGEPRGQFAAKFTSMNRGAAFPTPHFLIKEYQYKAHSEVIDAQQPDGSWTTVAGYERYATLLNKPRASRGGGRKENQLANSDKTAIAIRQLIFSNGQ